MRNGMSVQEIYDALDQLDRLIKAYDEERNKNISLKTELNDICWTIDRTIRQYTNLADDPETQLQDRIEFKGRAKGLFEAKQIIRNILDKKGDEDV